MRGTIAASLLLLLAGLPASAVEHPGVLHKEDICSTCHADKTRGKSVHSAIAMGCTVCHLAQTQGDMTTLNLLMPKERICSACHEQSEETRQHSSGAKGMCVDCHDSHSSDRRMLLRDEPPLRPSAMLPSRGINENGTAANFR
jgi:predicted CXXCH cytochrome family protein